MTAVRVRSEESADAVRAVPAVRPARAPAIDSLVGNRVAGALFYGQRGGGGQAPPARRILGLPDDVRKRVESLLAGNSAAHAQAAIDLIVDLLVKRGEIDRKVMRGGRMRFDATLKDDGHVQQWGERTKDGGVRLLPSTVRIGPSALASVSWLYSVIVHEYRHAERFQQPGRDPAKEVDAYLLNIERATEAGLTAAEIRVIWQRLREQWADLPDALKGQYQDRYDAAEVTVIRIAGPDVQQGPDPSKTSAAGTPDSCAGAVLTYAGSPGRSRCLPANDPEFAKDYVDNHIVLATGLCVPGTTWANLDHARVPEILLTYRDGRQLRIAVAHVPTSGVSYRNKRTTMGSVWQVSKYEKRADGFIYPIGGRSTWEYVDYAAMTNIVSLRDGLRDAIDEQRGLFLLMELGVTFGGNISALGGVGSLAAPSMGGRFRFHPQSGQPRSASRVPLAPPPRPQATGQPTPVPDPDPAGPPKAPPVRRVPTAQRTGSSTRTGDDTGLKPPKSKRVTPKAEKPGETGPDREPTAGTDRKDGGRKGEQTAAERDWEKAEAEARRQDAEADKPTRTEHGAIREQDRTALTPPERSQLALALPRTQADGATVRVIRQKGGNYLVHVTNKDGMTVTLIRDKTKEELAGLSRNYHWDPPWHE